MNGYTLCEYIQSDGTQYIDTGFKPNNNTRVVMDIVSLSTGQQSPFGARTSATSKNYSMLQTTILRSDYNNVYSQKFELPQGRFVIDKNKETTTVNGVAQSYTNSSFQCDYNMYLFSLDNSGKSQWASKMKLYSCQIYDNGTLVRDYIPCMSSEGVYGLYDNVNDVFYSSATDSGFTGKWAEQKCLNITPQEFRHRLMCTLKEDGIPAGTTFDFPYTGTVQEVTLPKGKYKLQCWGAQGGDSSATTKYKGGSGGYSVGSYTIEKTTTLFVVVGGAGGASSSTSPGGGGYNGGGKGGYGAGPNYGLSHGGAGGGGATHMATETGLLDSLSSKRTNIIIVAGGGGGISGVSEGGGNSLNSSFAASGGVGGGNSGDKGGSYYISGRTDIAKLSGYGGGKGTNSEAGKGGAPNALEADNSDNKYSGSGGGGGGAGYYGGGGGAGGSVSENGSYVMASTGKSGGFGNGGDGGNGADTSDGYYAGVGGGGGGGAGFVSSSLNDASTIAGDTSFPSVEGGIETGHSGNGYARITAIK